MKEITPHTDRERYLSFILDLGFSRVSHLNLFETGFCYDDTSRKRPRIWWKTHLTESPAFPVPSDATQPRSAANEPPIEVELYGKIDKSGLLYLAAFVGLNEKPVYSTHKERFFVLWSNSSGVIDAFEGKSGR